MDKIGEDVIREFMEGHVRSAEGERRRKLAKGLGYGERTFLEQVWWPAFGSLTDLSPEYEVRDYGDGPRFVDFAYIRGQVRLALEIDGYGPHARDADRHKFIDDRRRQNHLVVDGWLVMRFAYDEVAEQPRCCQQLLQQLMGRLFGGGLPANGDGLSVREKETLRLVARAGGSIKVAETAVALGVCRDTARECLLSLKAKGWLEAAGGGRKRVHTYRLSAQAEKVRF